MNKSNIERMYTISELRHEFGVTARTLRHYEDCGILTPRRSGTRRLYRPSDRVRLRLTLRGRRLGLSLAECREILDMYRIPADETKQITHLVDKISAREASLKQQRQDLSATLQELRRIRTRLQAHSKPKS